MTPPARRRRPRRSSLLALALIAGAFAAIATADSPVRAQQPPPSARVVLDADAGWRFSRGDFASAAMPAFDDAAWTTVDLPHDWSADGPFSAEFGSGNGYAPGGVGWYRKHFTLPPSLEGHVGAMEFDGIYDHSEIWVNGHLVGGRPYGYSSFEVPLTPFLRSGGADNVVAVRVDHSRFADSRWYTGSGIYRHVRMRFTDPLHVAHWGTTVTTPTVTAGAARVQVDTAIENASDGEKAFVLESEILLRGTIVARITTPGSASAHTTAALTQSLDVARPERWSTTTPTLYVVRQRVRAAAGVVDDAETTFGIRTIRFDPADGFFLNEEPIELKGVCLHHDAGSVGAAVPIAVWERRLGTLKAIGVNAIRTSHNPPAPEFLDLADRMGFLVKDEAFDEFTPAKNKWVEGWNAGVPSRFGYAEDFAEWSVRDVEDMVRRDRNHPSVIMWSIGNEVDYPNDPFSDPVLGQRYRATNPPAANLVTLARPLIDAVHRLDATRPVTMALASAEMSDAVGLGELLDIVGYNYQESRYAADHAKYPARVLFGSETGHSYESWTTARDNAYVSGQFLWTGIDYLGEARTFPNRANGAGLLDLAGFMKPMARFRQSLWSNEPMVALAAMPAPAANAAPRARAARPEEHWNWAVGTTMRVVAWTNADEVTLSLNGRAVGTKRRADAEAGVLSWDVPFEPGVLTAVATTGGARVAEFSLRSAGAARRIELVDASGDASSPEPDGSRTAQVEYCVVDANGVRVPDADAPVTIAIEGSARLLGMGNGNLNDVDSGGDATHRAFEGRGLIILRLTDPLATATVRASSPGLAGAAIVVGGR
ncbi:MAG: glycoside hydrolase family 2 TIM barrel-domain containing protein [Vicinamibacterales bacterium]